MTEQTALTLISTVVAPAFAAGSLELEPLHAPLHMTLPAYLHLVRRNLHGHAPTVEALRQESPGLPLAERGFWTGEGVALAVRPRGGVRNAAAEGASPVRLEELEAVLVRWHPAPGVLSAAEWEQRYGGPYSEETEWSQAGAR